MQYQPPHIEMLQLLFVWVRLLFAASILLGTVLPFVLAQIFMVIFASPFSRELSFRVNQMLCGVHVYTYLIMIHDVMGIEIVFSGDKIRKYESAVQILNHISFFDYWILCSSVATRALRGNAVRYFGKEEIFYYFPFGTGLYLSGTVYFKRNWKAFAHLVEQAFSFMYSMPELPIWLVIFPEGTRFTPDKQKKSQQFARERNLNVLTHVLNPRYKGFQVTVDHIRPLIDVVYDITAAFEGNRYPTLTTLLNGTYARTVYIEVDRHPVHSLPDSKEGLKTWLYDAWDRKDAKLEYFNKHGKFPGTPYVCPPGGLFPNLWHGLFATRKFTGQVPSEARLSVDSQYSQSSSQ